MSTQPVSEVADAVKALADDLLERLEAAGLEPTPAELVQLAAIEKAAARLEGAEAVIAEDGLTVTGSMGQTRPHPLLSLETELRKDVADRTERLARTVDDRLEAHARESTGRIGAALLADASRTDTEIADTLAVPVQTISAARAELSRTGLL